MRESTTRSILGLALLGIAGIAMHRTTSGSRASAGPPPRPAPRPAPPPAPTSRAHSGATPAEDRGQNTSELDRINHLAKLTRELRRYRASGGDRTPLDRLVSTLLRPLDGPAQSRELAALLIDQPFLGLAHERAVLAAAAAASADTAPLVASLLCTLWHNLERQGARTPTELSALALRFLEDARPARRLAGALHLLDAGQGRFRALVLGPVLRDRDVTLARALLDRPELGENARRRLLSLVEHASRSR